MSEPETFHLPLDVVSFLCKHYHPVDTEHALRLQKATFSDFWHLGARACLDDLLATLRSESTSTTSAAGLDAQRSLRRKELGRVLAAMDDDAALPAQMCTICQHGCPSDIQWLPCGHSFCACCLDRQMKEFRAACPNCRLVVPSYRSIADGDAILPPLFTHSLPFHPSGDYEYALLLQSGGESGGGVNSQSVVSSMDEAMHAVLEEEEDWVALAAQHEAGMLSAWRREESWRRRREWRSEREARVERLAELGADRVRDAISSLMFSRDESEVAVLDSFIRACADVANGGSRGRGLYATSSSRVPASHVHDYVMRGEAGPHALNQVWTILVEALSSGSREMRIGALNYLYSRSNQLQVTQGELRPPHVTRL